MPAQTQTGAENIHWDLSHLYHGEEDPGLSRDLEEVDKRAEAFAQDYKGRIAGLSARRMHELLQELEAIYDLEGRASTFAYLAWSTHTQLPSRGALLQRASEHSSRLHQKLLFAELEWAAAAEEQAGALLSSPELAHYRHWLELVRRYRPHLLSEPEEKVLAEKSVTGRSAWVRYFEELHSSALYELDGQRLPQQSVLTRLYDPDREVRRRAARAMSEGLKGLERSSTFIFNTLLADKSSDDRLRHYPSWIAARNLDNQIDDATVEALIGAVTSRYDLVSRYYGLKKKLLDLPELRDYDRYAPLPRAGRQLGWQEAREIVLSSYAQFHPRMAEIAGVFFDSRWIDAAVSEGKRGGAFSHGAVPSAHPYVFLNYEGSPRHVMTLAHELGHGVHQFLARKQGILAADTPLTTAETASVFGEMLVFHNLLEREQDTRARLALLVQKIEESFATVFRQVAMNRFEQAVHTERREKGELAPERFGQLWLETQRAMFRDSVTLTEDYGLWWSYVSHFMHTPGYVYAYAFGELLVLALYARYRKAGPSFADRYLAMLEAGGSDWPEALVAPLGVDLKDPRFWHEGLEILEGMVAQAEQMAHA